MAFLDRLSEKPAIGHALKRLIAYILVVAGAIYLTMPVPAAAVLGINVDTPNGIREVQRFYGGGQIGLGIFMLQASSKEAFRMLLYAMALLASARCFCTAPFVLHMWRVPFKEPFDRFVHLAVAFFIEFPGAAVAGFALETWAAEHLREDGIRKRLMFRVLPQVYSNRTFVLIVKLSCVLILSVLGAFFLVLPRFTGELFELHAGFALGIIELQAMLGALRLALAMFLVGCDDHHVLLFCLCFFGSSYLMVESMLLLGLV